MTFNIIPDKLRVKWLSNATRSSGQSLIPSKRLSIDPKPDRLVSTLFTELQVHKKKPLYIGKSQDLGRRLGEHQQGFSHIGDKETKKLSYSFGTIYSLSGSITTADISPQQLRDVESFFINELQPLGNDPATKKRYKGTSLIVINIGKPVPFDKVIAHNKELLKLLKANLTTKRTTSSTSSAPSLWG